MKSTLCSKLKFFQLVLILPLVMGFLFSNLAQAMNGRTTYQAKIMKPDGQPLEAGSVNFRFTVLDTVGSCVLYVENYTGINMNQSGGLVSFALGNGTRTFPASGTSQTFQNIFDNSTPSFSCQVPGIYNPGANDTRRIVMQFNDGNGWQTLPAMTINAVPYSMYAVRSNDSHALNGKADTAFVENATLAALNCNPATHAITFNGASFSCIAVGNTLTSGSITTALGYTPTNSASFTTMSSNVSNLTTYASSVSSTVFSVSSTLTSFQGTVAASFAAITSSQWLTSGTTISYGSGRVGIGSLNPVTTLDVSGGIRIGSESATCNSSYAGTLRYNSGIVEYCNGSSWAAFGVSGAGIIAINGLTSGSQTFAFAANGTTPSVSSVGSVHTFNFPYASVGTTTSGLISHSDYLNFVSKQDATSSALISTLGYTPANAVSFTSLNSNLSSVSATVDTLAGNLNGVSNAVTTAQSNIQSVLSAVNTLANSVSASYTTLSSTVGLVSTTVSSLSVSKITSSAASIAQVLGYTPAASGLVTSQWNTSGTTINYMSGNVGVGTTIPGYNLTVSGTSHFNSQMVVGNTPPAAGIFDLGPLLGSSSTYSSPFVLNQTVTDFTHDFTLGKSAALRLNAYSSTSGYVANDLNYTQNVSGNGMNYGSVMSGFNITENNGSGNILQLTGTGSYVFQNGAGTATHVAGVNSKVYTYSGTSGNAYGGWFGSTNTGGTIINNYGVKIDGATGTATTNYGLYVGDAGLMTASYTVNIFSSGSSSKNIFEGHAGIGGVYNPSAKLHLGAGIASEAPFKFTSGTLLTSPASGALEYDGFNLYYTDGTNTRRTIAANTGTGTYDAVNAVANSSGNIALYPNSGAGSVVVSATTASTNSQNGALVVKGGVGVAGNINSSGSLNVSGSSVIDGTLKISSLTSGGVLFAGANGVVTQDNSNFYWDNSNKFLGLGTSAPTALLDVSGDNFTATSTAAPEGIRLVAKSARGASFGGGAINIAAGDAFSTTGGKLGGAINITGGKGHYTSGVTANARGGGVTITGGPAAGTFVNTVGGWVQAVGGTGGVSGTGGSVSVAGGSGGSVVGSGGGLSMLGGNAAYEGNGGNVSIWGGGAATGAGNVVSDGNIALYTRNGNVTSATGGSIGVFATSTGIPTLGTGEIYLFAGKTNSANGAGSNITLQAGQPNGTGEGGNIILQPGYAYPVPGQKIGKVGIGLTSPAYHLSVSGTIYGNSGIYENSVNSSAGSSIVFWKHRNYAATQTSDELGYMSFVGHDGTGLYRSALIAAYSDATPNSTAHSVPGRITFSTTTSGSTDVSEKMRISSDGKVGIGTTSPGAKLQVGATATDETRIGFLSFINNPDHKIDEFFGIRATLSDSAGSNGFRVYNNSSTQLFVVKSNGRIGINNEDTPGSNLAVKGNATVGSAYSQTAAPANGLLVEGSVGIGTTSPGAKLDVASSQSPLSLRAGAGGYNFINMMSGSTSQQSWSLNDSSNADLKINRYVSGTYADSPMTFQNATGYVGILNSNPSYPLDVTGQARFTGGYTTSDVRYKRNIETLNDSLESILKLRGVTYDFRVEEFPKWQFSKNRQVGLIAQEVEMIYPQVVETDKEGFKSVNYQALVSPIIEAIKAVYNRIVGLENSIEKQNRQIAQINETKVNREELEYLKLKASEVDTLKSENSELKNKIKEFDALKSYLCSKDPNIPTCKN